MHVFWLSLPLLYDISKCRYYINSKVLNSDSISVMLSTTMTFGVPLYTSTSTHVKHM